MSKKAKSPTAAELAAAVEEQRRQLAQTVDEVTTALHPKTIATDMVAELKNTAENASEQARAFTAELRADPADTLRIAGWAAVTILALTGIAIIRRNR